MNMKRFIMLSITLAILTSGMAFARGSSESNALATVIDTQTILQAVQTNSSSLTDAELASIANTLGLQSLGGGSDYYTQIVAQLQGSELTAEELAAVAEILGLVPFNGDPIGFSGPGSADFPGMHQNQQQLNLAEGTDIDNASDGDDDQSAWEPPKQEMGAMETMQYHQEIQNQERHEDGDHEDGDREEEDHDGGRSGHGRD